MAAAHLYVRAHVLLPVLRATDVLVASCKCDAGNAAPVPDVRPNSSSSVYQRSCLTNRFSVRCFAARVRPRRRHAIRNAHACRYGWRGRLGNHRPSRFQGRPHSHYARSEAARVAVSCASAASSSGWRACSRGCMSSNPSIERTSQRSLRALCAAAHVKR